MAPKQSSSVYFTLRNNGPKEQRLTHFSSCYFGRWDEVCGAFKWRNNSTFPRHLSNSPVCLGPPDFQITPRSSSVGQKVYIDFPLILSPDFPQGKTDTHSSSIKGDKNQSNLLNNRTDDSLSWKQGLADIIAPSCLALMPHITFLLIHGARCKHHVALTSLILFPLSCSQTTMRVHRHVLLGVEATS